MSFDGFLLVNKEEGPTSFDVVKKARKVFQTKKAGHCGTLDPLASGLLIIAVGNGTKLIPYLSIEPKVYEFGLQFGTSTTTMDREGEIVKKGYPVPEEADLLQFLKELIGELEQRPPKYSAIKINGVPAYKLARRNEEFDIKSRMINIYELDLLNFNKAKGEAFLRVSCSGGTYVRVLCEQIAAKLNTVGFATCINRTTIGKYSVENSLSSEAEEVLWREGLFSLYDIFKLEDHSFINEDDERELSFGREVTVKDTLGETVFLFKQNRDLAAVAQKKQNFTYGPKRVFL